MYHCAVITGSQRIWDANNTPDSPQAVSQVADPRIRKRPDRQTVRHRDIQEECRYAR